MSCRLDSPLRRGWILLVPAAAILASVLLLVDEGRAAFTATEVVRTDAPSAGGVLTSPVRAVDAEGPRPGAAVEAAPPVRSVGPSAADDPARAPTLTGRVVDAFGRGVRGARVTATPRGREPSDTDPLVLSEEDGRFALLGVPDRSVDVRAIAVSYGPAWVPDVAAGPPVEIRLPPAARLVCAVCDADGAPVEEARVRVRRPGFERIATTDATGLVEVDGLPEGVVEVRARAAGGTALVRGVVLDAEEGVLVACNLSPATSIRGHVTAHGSGEPVAGAAITLRLAGWPVEDDPVVTSDETGAFALRTSLLPGERLEIHARCEGYADGCVDLDPTLAASGLDLVLWPQRWLNGLVTRPDGRPAPGIRISWADDPEGRSVAVSDARGLFRAPLPPGAAAGRVHALAATGERGSFGATAVRLPADGQPLSVVVRTSGCITGRVMDPEGQGLEGALVLVEPSSSTVPGLAATADEAWARSRALAAVAHHTHAVSGKDGAYRLLGVPAGAWTLRIVHGGIQERRLEPLLLAEGATLSQDVIVGRAASLFGRVVDADGLGIPGARVLAVPASRGSPEGRGAATTSGPGGRYRLDGLRRDRALDVVVSAPGRVPTRLDAVLPGDRELPVRLDAP